MSVINDLLEQLLNLRSELLFAVVLYVLGFALKRIEKFPNTWIPLVIILAGAAGGYFIFDNPGAADPAMKNPEIRAVMLGLVVGFAVWMFHEKLGRYIESFIERFLPAGLKPGANAEPPAGNPS